jgi:hypothetical protein
MEMPINWVRNILSLGVLCILTSCFNNEKLFCVEHDLLSLGISDYLIKDTSFYQKYKDTVYIANNSITSGYKNTDLELLVDGKIVDLSSTKSTLISNSCMRQILNSKIKGEKFYKTLSTKEDVFNVSNVLRMKNRTSDSPKYILFCEAYRERDGIVYFRFGKCDGYNIFGFEYFIDKNRKKIIKAMELSNS